MNESPARQCRLPCLQLLPNPSTCHTSTGSIIKTYPIEKRRDNPPLTTQTNHHRRRNNNVHPPPPPTLPPPAPPPPHLHHNPAPLRNLQPSPERVPQAPTKTQTRIPRHVRNPKPLHEGSMPKSIRHGTQKTKFRRT